jgi:hypothetical protein
MKIDDDFLIRKINDTELDNLPIIRKTCNKILPCKWPGFYRFQGEIIFAD